MPVYEYTAIDAAGKGRKGIVDADSPRTARQKLRADGIYPTHLEETHTRERSQRLSRWQVRITLQRVTRAELVSTTRQLATLLVAGLPLVAALSGVLEQVKREALRKVLSHVRERVNEGMSLAAALREHPSVFPSMYTAMVHAGETSGTLELVMERLADFGEQQLALQRKIRSTLAYPMLMLTVGLGVVFFLMTYVIPKVTQIFQDMKQALPLPTVILIRVSSLFQKFWPVLILVAFLCWFLGRYYIRSQKGQRYYHRQLLRMPVVGELVQKVAIGRIARTLGTLLHNGVPLLSAMEIVRSLVDNVILGEALDEARQEISEGAGIAAPLARGGVFPPTVIQMISVGEQSGNLEGMLFKVAETFESEVESRLTALTSLLEPVMILALGALVGFVVLAVLLPIFEMSHLVR
ncbi:MAG: type II secretion system inner membrane protein GspF [Deltaproteobacteria bacterium]|nr:MAG: type II secretion system inner membrane protein GspF [Deltaproteobacteria bacterium]